MKRDASKIVEEINRLVAELASLAGVETRQPGKALGSSSPKKVDTSGATGGIRLLIDEGKISKPLEMNQIKELLTQEGRHYRSQTISMGLLYLVRSRSLTRLKESGSTKWKYVARR